MPSLMMYVTTEDTQTLFQLLLKESELASIVADGPGRWKAAGDKSGFLTVRRSCFWHTASGPLPLLAAPPGEQSAWIDDPWSGWTERRSGADSSLPYFGAGWPGVFWLNLATQAKAATNICGLSSFEWIGDRYKILDKGARPETHRCWNRLCSRIRKVGMKVPRGALAFAAQPEVYAFPAAMTLLQSGKQADINHTPVRNAGAPAAGSS